MIVMSLFCGTFFFFFNDTATTEIYTLSLHDALPIWQVMKTGEPLVIEDASTHPLMDVVRAGMPSHAFRSLRSEEHTSELQSQSNLVCRLLLEKKKNSTL